MLGITLEEARVMPASDFDACRRYLDKMGYPGTGEIVEFLAYIVVMLQNALRSADAPALSITDLLPRLREAEDEKEEQRKRSNRLDLIMSAVRANEKKEDD